mmetsp:Transcript_69940/g.114711  ORF Transcript_69940/g.114711 Transcript_69940/m.114711 type:complete len:198 (-) Transcript_69940:140-733(-)
MALVASRGSFACHCRESQHCGLGLPTAGEAAEATALSVDLALGFIQALEARYLSNDVRAVEEFLEALEDRHRSPLQKVHRLVSQSEDPGRLIEHIILEWELEGTSASQVQLGPDDSSRSMEPWSTPKVRSPSSSSPSPVRRASTSPAKKTWKRGYGSLGVLDPLFAYVEGHLQQIRYGPSFRSRPTVIRSVTSISDI